MKSLYTIILIAVVLSAASCSKDYLDAKPNASLVVPSSIADFQALLSTNNRFNVNQPLLGELSSDDFFYPQSTYNTLSPLEQNSYTWAVDVFSGITSVGDWDGPYANILSANLALQGASSISPSADQQTAYNTMKGTAYFMRGWLFYEVACLFAPQYDSSTASTDLGIPLKTNPDVNQRAGRATVKDTYTQILSDLKNSVGLLPLLPVNNNYFEPSRGAAFGMLSRVYMSMRDYPDALSASDSALVYFNTLVDYNSINAGKSYPMGYPNQEIFFDYTLINYFGINREAYVDSSLYKSYDTSDLRRSLFYSAFDGTGNRFRGFYYLGPLMEGGLCTDEMYLNRAECYARAGNATLAMSDLNTLLIKRYKSTEFVPYSGLSASDALTTVLLERRKELLYRGIRWNDLRRLNKESQFAVTLNRYIGGQSYSLPPNDPRYVFPIPQDELLYNPVTQNQR